MSSGSKSKTPIHTNNIPTYKLLATCPEKIDWKNILYIYLPNYIPIRYLSRQNISLCYLYVNDQMVSRSICQKDIKKYCPETPGR